MTSQATFVTDNDKKVRIDYASQQLDIYRSALTHWQIRASTSDTPYQRSHAQYELAYYTQQVDRWQNYLALLMK
jgi:hypothetical protein